MFSFLLRMAEVYKSQVALYFCSNRAVSWLKVTDDQLMCIKPIEPFRYLNIAHLPYKPLKLEHRGHIGTLRGFMQEEKVVTEKEEETGK